MRLCTYRRSSPRQTNRTNNKQTNKQLALDAKVRAMPQTLVQCEHVRQTNRTNKQQADKQTTGFGARALPIALLVTHAAGKRARGNKPNRPTRSNQTKAALICGPSRAFSRSRRSQKWEPSQSAVKIFTPFISCDHVNM